MDFGDKLNEKVSKSYQGSLKNIKDIYKNAANRQNVLVNIIFENCLIVGLSNFISTISNGNADEKVNLLLQRGIIKNSDNASSVKDFILKNKGMAPLLKVAYFLQKGIFINYLDIVRNDRSLEENQKLEKFLKDNADLIGIYYADGKVKTLERAVEKINDRYAGDITQINDVNRLTIISESSELIQNVFSLLHKEFKDEFCARDDWEMKSFGMITRSSYLFLDGFPCEIHFSEPKQRKLSENITHKIYEVYRININTPEKIERFKNSFISLLKNLNKDGNQEYINISKKIFKDNYSDADFSIENLPLRKDEVLQFHVFLHQNEILKTKDDWQIDYLTSLYLYNSQKKKKMKEYVNFSDAVKEGANKKFINKTKEQRTINAERNR